MARSHYEVITCDHVVVSLVKFWSLRRSKQSRSVRKKRGEHDGTAAVSQERHCVIDDLDGVGCRIRICLKAMSIWVVNTSIHGMTFM
jgi:hypothetical protein